MNIKEIFYRTQHIKYYELLTRTLKGTDKKIRTFYEVVWHTLKDNIREEITKEEYEILLEGLEK